MLHKSELGEHADRFPTDAEGNVPEEGDHWSDLNYEHGPHDPDEEGISDEERARRMEFLDNEWWPKIIAHVNEQKETLSQLPGGNPIHRWRQAVIDDAKPRAQHGFEAGEVD